MSKKQTVFNLLFLVIVFGLTVYLVFRGKDIGDIIRTAREADGRYLLLSLVCVVFFILGESVIILILSRLVDTFSSRILYPMLLLSGNHSIAVV